MASEGLSGFVQMFLAALFASAITHLLTYRRFVMGRRLDRKAGAYDDVVGALADMEISLRGCSRVDTMVREIERRGEEVPRVYVKYMVKIALECEEAMRRVVRAAAEGDYLISKGASNALSELFEKYPYVVREGVSWEDELLNWVRVMADRVGPCLEVVRGEAKRECVR